MIVEIINNENFTKFGKIITGYDCSEILNKMNDIPQTKDVIYVPSCPDLESLEIFHELTNDFFGGLDIQIGYCIGENTKLNAVEYHRSSEINIACTNLILLVGMQQDICEYSGTYFYDSSEMEAFMIPKGTMVELYATTLHYAPINKDGFKSIVVLPLNTNTPLEKKLDKNNESKLLFAKNKWLLAHKDSNLEDLGAYIGIEDNIELNYSI